METAWTFVLPDVNFQFGAGGECVAPPCLQKQRTLRRFLTSIAWLTRILIFGHGWLVMASPRQSGGRTSASSGTDALPNTPSS